MSFLKDRQNPLKLSAKKFTFSNVAGCSWDFLKLTKEYLTLEYIFFPEKVVYCLPNLVFPKIIYYRKRSSLLIFSSPINFNISSRDLFWHNSSKEIAETAGFL